MKFLEDWGAAGPDGIARLRGARLRGTVRNVPKTDASPNVYGEKIQDWQ